MLAACSGSSEVGSNTPQVTIDDNPEASLEARLLTVAQVEQALGGSGLTQAEISDTPVFENPDPRGPCGGIVPQLPLGEGTVGRSFGASNITIVQFVSPLSELAAAYLKAIAADATPGCGPFESETNQGLMQKVSDIEIIDVTGVSSDAVAYAGRVDVGGQTFHIAAVALADDGASTFLQIGAQDPIDPRAVHALAATANEVLGGGG
jgi:hypothetical protein